MGKRKGSWLMVRASKEKLLGNIETVVGVCPHCNEKALLLSIVEDIFKCTLCDQDVQQYVNGHIKYIVMDDEKKDLLKKFFVLHYCLTLLKQMLLLNSLTKIRDFE